MGNQSCLSIAQRRTYLNNSKSWTTRTYTLLDIHPLSLNLHTLIQWNCYSESGRPRHIFSLLPSSRYSQMTNLTRETKGNNLGTGAVDLRGLECDGGCVTLGLRAGRERQRHRAHSIQTKMRGGRRWRTRLSLFFFVTGHHEMCPTGNLTTRWGWGEWRELLWPGRIENLSLFPRWLSTNSR